MDDLHAQVAGMSPEQLTALNLDKTELLEQVLQKEYGGSWMEFLGELQFSFLVFLMGQSLEGQYHSALMHVL